MKSIYGWIASSVTLIYKLPQIYKLIKTKQSKDISVFSLITQCIGYIFYILHGVSINDIPIIFMGVGALIQNIILVILWYFYKENRVKNELENNVDNKT